MSKLPADHPFSIASLTSPGRTKSEGSSPSIITSSFHFSGKGHFYPTTPLRIATKQDSEMLQGALKSPISSTGSADCSPDTSFCSSVTDNQTVFHDDVSDSKSPSRASSPAASDDSGRGSPPVLPVSPVEPKPERQDEESEEGAEESTSDKPSHSYIALISMAILASPEKKLVLSDIYQYIMDNFPFYNNQERAWRNSIRHNLSLNECFIKAGRADNGKGNFWAIHPACVEDFAKGDFRRRQARRRARANVPTADQMAALQALRGGGGGVAYSPHMIAPAANALHCYMPGFPFIPPAYAPLFNNSAELHHVSPAGIPSPSSSPGAAAASHQHQAQLAMAAKMSSHSASLIASPYLAMASSSGRPVLSMRNPAVMGLHPGHLPLPYSHEAASNVRYSPYGRPPSHIPPFW